MDLTRHKQPALVPVDVKVPHSPKPAELSNGIRLFEINCGTEDLIRVDFVFRAGIIRESRPLLATTTNMMLQEGSEHYSAKELNAILDFYGVYQNLYSGKDTAGLKIYFLNKYAEKVLDLVKEMLFNPLFPESELDVLMKKRLNWYMITRNKVQNLASDQFFELVFGRNHPYGRQICKNDFHEINPMLLREFHAQYYRPEEMTVILSGRLNEDIVGLFNKYFGALKSEKILTGDKVKLPVGLPVKKKHIEKRDALQTAIRIGSATINKRHHDYHGLKIVNMILGGYFGSRLMKNLREEKGLTYGIQSTVSSLDLAGFKVIAAEVGKEHKEKAADEIYKEIKILQSEPVSNVEIEIVRNYMLGELVRQFDGPFALAESFKSAWEFGLDFDHFRQFAEKIKNITQDEIIKLANTYYYIDELNQITAG